MALRNKEECGRSAHGPQVQDPALVPAPTPTPAAAWRCCEDLRPRSEGGTRVGVAEPWLCTALHGSRGPGTLAHLHPSPPRQPRPTAPPSPGHRKRHSSPCRSFPEQTPHLPNLPRKGVSAPASCGPHLAARGRAQPPRIPWLPRDAQSPHLTPPGLSRAGPGYWEVPEEHGLKNPTRTMTQGRDSPSVLACVRICCLHAPLGKPGQDRARHAEAFGQYVG